MLTQTENKLVIRFVPFRDTAAAIVQRCTTGEQPSCRFYTSELVWSFLQVETKTGRVRAKGGDTKNCRQSAESQQAQLQEGSL